MCTWWSEFRYLDGWHCANLCSAVVLQSYESFSTAEQSSHKAELNINLEPQSTTDSEERSNSCTLRDKGGSYRSNNGNKCVPGGVKSKFSERTFSHEATNQSCVSSLVAVEEKGSLVEKVKSEKCDLLMDDLIVVDGLTFQ